MARLDELKKEVLELEAQAKAQQNQQLGSGEPTAPAATDEAEQIRKIFNAILGLDEAERQASEDQAMHVCASCFTLQPRTNAICELCGSSSEWLVPSQARNNAEQDMFIRMAAGHTVDELKISLQSGWSHTPQRERVARLLLVSKESKLIPQANVEKADCTSEEPPVEVQQIDFDALLKHYDRKIEAIASGTNCPNIQTSQNN